MVICSRVLIRGFQNLWWGERKTGVFRVQVWMSKDHFCESLFKGRVVVSTAILYIQVDSPVSIFHFTIGILGLQM